MNTAAEAFDAGARQAPAFTSSGMAYRRLGGGPPVVLFHGGYGSWRHWKRNLRDLSTQRTVIALDLPGYGDSGDVDPGIALDAYVARVTAGVKEIVGEAPAVDLAGFSFGGFMSVGVAASLGGRARKLSTIAPSGFGKSAGRKLDLRSRKRFPEGEAGEREYLRHNLQVLMIHDPAAIDEEALQIQKANLLQARFDNKAITFADRYTDYLRSLRCPLQLIYGEFDSTAHPSQEACVGRCREISPGLRLDIVPHAGHWVQYEKPAETSQRILDFLNT